MASFNVENFSDLEADAKPMDNAMPDSAHASALGQFSAIDAPTNFSEVSAPVAVEESSRKFSDAVNELELVSNVPTNYATAEYAFGVAHDPQDTAYMSIIASSGLPAAEADILSPFPSDGHQPETHLVSDPYNPLGNPFDDYPAIDANDNTFEAIYQPEAYLSIEANNPTIAEPYPILSEPYAIPAEADIIAAETHPVENPSAEMAFAVDAAVEHPKPDVEIRTAEPEAPQCESLEHPETFENPEPEVVKDVKVTLRVTDDELGSQTVKLSFTYAPEPDRSSVAVDAAQVTEAAVVEETSKAAVEEASLTVSAEAITESAEEAAEKAEAIAVEAAMFADVAEQAAEEAELKAEEAVLNVKKAGTALLEALPGEESVAAAQEYEAAAEEAVVLTEEAVAAAEEAEEAVQFAVAAAQEAKVAADEAEAVAVEEFVAHHAALKAENVEGAESVSADALKASAEAEEAEKAEAEAEAEEEFVLVESQMEPEALAATSEQTAEVLASAEEFAVAEEELAAEEEQDDEEKDIEELETATMAVVEAAEALVTEVEADEAAEAEIILLDDKKPLTPAVAGSEDVVSTEAEPDLIEVAVFSVSNDEDADLALVIEDNAEAAAVAVAVAGSESDAVPVSPGSAPFPAVAVTAAEVSTGGEVPVAAPSTSAAVALEAPITPPALAPAPTDVAATSSAVVSSPTPASAAPPSAAPASAAHPSPREGEDLVSRKIANANYPQQMKELMDREVVPILRRGMKEMVRRRVEDPCEFLADYLRRHNPRRQQVAGNAAAAAGGGTTSAFPSVPSPSLL